MTTLIQILLRKRKRRFFLLGWEVLPHPSNSPKLAPSDFHIFKSHQHTLAGQSFKTCNDVKKLINISKDESFYNKGIQMLTERWQKIIHSNGEYLVTIYL